MGKSKLEPYLINNLNAGTIPSLQWRSRQERVFMVRLVNRNNKKWSIDDGKLLQGYAHLSNETGECDYKILRRQFRDAIRMNGNFKRWKTWTDNHYKCISYKYVGNLEVFHSPVIEANNQADTSLDLSSTASLSSQSVNSTCTSQSVNSTCTRSAEDSEYPITGHLSDDLRSIHTQSLLAANPVHKGQQQSVKSVGHLDIISETRNCNNIFAPEYPMTTSHGDIVCTPEPIRHTNPLPEDEGLVIAQSTTTSKPLPPPAQNSILYPRDTITSLWAQKPIEHNTSSSIISYNINPGPQQTVASVNLSRSNNSDATSNLFGVPSLKTTISSAFDNNNNNTHLNSIVNTNAIPYETIDNNTSIQLALSSSLSCLSTGSPVADPYDTSSFKTGDPSAHLFASSYQTRVTPPCRNNRITTGHNIENLPALSIGVSVTSNAAISTLVFSSPGPIVQEDPQISLQSEIFSPIDTSFGNFIYNKLSPNNLAKLKSKAPQLIMKNIQYSGNSIQYSGNSINGAGNKLHNRPIIFKYEHTSDQPSHVQQTHDYIYLPAANLYVEEGELRKQTDRILRKGKDGITVISEGINVYALNHSRVNTYATSAYYTNMLLERNEKTKIFDMNTFYMLTLKQGTKSCNPTIYISLGRQWNTAELESKARILLSIESCVAITFLQMERESNSISSVLESMSWSDIEESLPDGSSRSSALMATTEPDSITATPSASLIPTTVIAAMTPGVLPAQS